MKLLGIETSCDETGVAIIDGNRNILAEQLYSQIDIHAEYGGVVPELASRDHIRKLLPLTQRCLDDAKLTISDIDAIAYTAGPGLVGALFVGASVGQSMAWALGVPAIPVHHMEAHLLVPFLEHGVEFPFLCLLVSGGHTMLVHAHALGEYTLLGQSRDDAVGEAFDKVAKQLGLGYPGGPAIERLATSAVVKADQFPRPMLENTSLDFSFSGLKTHALLTYQKTDKSELDKAEIAYDFQQAILDTLYKKCERALAQTGLNKLVIAGGVSANKKLRAYFSTLEDEGVKVMFPDLKVCTDNGVMIAYTGLLYALNETNTRSNEVKVFPRWSLQHA